ncbi:MAG: hypothetical protein NUV54_03590, partial [Candidatus Taylorbacteria bacterium]|nr:hypothetical protein [Candidatus Taylorbacteria bacterium]
VPLFPLSVRRQDVIWRKEWSYLLVISSHKSLYESVTITNKLCCLEMVCVQSWRDPSVLSLMSEDKKDTLDFAKVSFLFET